ncbi:M23 family metallopeptidase [Nioella nitratireducens]|uniref:M23 family metallopeptidase n=1 Tax=Nioella nitratireducens TaxID=1287720 RepID=UPI0008FD5288|nr:M23 family metallopeptidase [Nioella nitratireducens]
MKTRLTNRLNTVLERYLPEQRLFLKSDQGMRYVRLRPATQAVMLTGCSLVVGWTVIVTSIFLIDSISAGSVRDQAERAQIAYESRLNAISQERDARASEAQASQERFSVAMDEVSAMQSRLLASEERRRELETAVEVIQTTLRRVMGERDTAREQMAALQAEIENDDSPVQTAAARAQEMERTVDYLSMALRRAADERDDAVATARNAEDEVGDLEFTQALADERNERIFAQIEDAVEMSMAPLDTMFQDAGLSTDDLVNQMRASYNGQGGPLMPITMSSSGEEPDPEEIRANEVLAQLDLLNLRRMAAENLPFSMPLRTSYRISSTFGYRSDPFNGGRRLHSGVDMAGAHGSPIYATGDGVVSFAGRQSGYGNVVVLRHAMGFETRYAHMSRIRVQEGQRVSRGDRIGDMGSTGRSTGPHLHYEVRTGGTPRNPMTYITAGRNVF